MLAERCLIDAIHESNSGSREDRSYLQEKLPTKQPVPAGQIGETVSCDRCLAVFRINAGGVYLELEGEGCDQVRGASGDRHDWQINIDFTHLY